MEENVSARVPPPMRFEGNLSENFKEFKRQFEIYLLATGNDQKEDKTKVAILLNIMGEEAIDIFHNFGMSEANAADYSKVIKKFEEYLNPKKNVTYERFVFNKRWQRKGEPFDQFMQDIKNLIKTCEYQTQEADILKDKIVIGINDKKLQVKLLCIDDLKLDKCVEMCRASENTKGGKIKIRLVRKRSNQNGQSKKEEKEPEKKTEELSNTDLYKKVSGVLNKLTPQKFNTLLNQIKTLPIDTSERLLGVVDLVFEKAVDEPNSSVTLSLMCKELALMKIPVTAETKEYVNFRKLLVTRCQMEFEKNSFKEGNCNDKIREIDDCADPEKKKEMLMSLEEDDRRIQMRSLGNIRFIGELFKQKMLTINIMMRCLQKLIENQDEGRLECLCKLLTTIGKELDNKKVDLSGIFGTMKDIVDKKNSKVSSRVRFMLLDVIDLRSTNWIPLRQDLN